jgi:hypothetical protein
LNLLSQQVINSTDNRLMSCRVILQSRKLSRQSLQSLEVPRKLRWNGLSQFITVVRKELQSSHSNLIDIKFSKLNKELYTKQNVLNISQRGKCNV